MRRRITSKSTFFFLFFFLATDVSYAAGIIMRIQQMKRMKQQQAQGMSQQENEEYQEEQQGEQAQNQQAAPLTYQQTVDQRNQAIAQAILNAHNQAVSTENLNNTIVSQAQEEPVAPGTAQQQGIVPAVSSTVQDVVDLSEVWKKLDKKSTVWALLIDDQAKLLTVSEYIDRFQKQGVKISAPPMHYVKTIDQVAQGNPQMLQRPFGELLQILAIVDYDFDNGMDKDALAKAVLGESGYETNKKRFTQQQAPP